MTHFTHNITESAKRAFCYVAYEITQPLFGFGVDVDVDVDVEVDVGGDISCSLGGTPAWAAALVATFVLT